jgi:hypothetical protein
VTVSGYSLSGADSGNYVLEEPTGLAANITQLGSVAWVGGATGNWSNASNWAGGAIPDYSNVAAVTIPTGTTVTYDAGVPGTTVLSTLTDSGKLVMAAGELSTTSNLSITGGYRQSGGTLSVGGMLSIVSTSGALTLGNIDANTADITSKAGAITQAASTALDVTGATSLIADDGVTGTGDAKYNITVTQPGNSFGGVVTSNGSNIDLLDSSASGLVLGNTIATGELTATSRAGAISQAASTAVDVSGATSLTASNGLTGAGVARYNITLAQADNSFAGQVTSNGLNIDLADSSAAGLLLGNTTATGTLTATSTGGAIIQAAYTTVNVTGASMLTADNGDITLANATNNFGGAVSSAGVDISLLDKTGGLILGNTTATGNLADTSLGGSITQGAGTMVDVTGATTLTADNGDVKHNITLAQTQDSFNEAVTADGSAITIYDLRTLTAILDSSGASTLTSAGAMNVSGTVGTALTTTAGVRAATTFFGETTVGTTLKVSGGGTAPVTSTGILTVGGEATTTYNPNVTVRGVKGVTIN